MSSKKICVVGLGYIGLPTATLFSNKGFQVHGVDKNSKIVNIIVFIKLFVNFRD